MISRSAIFGNSNRRSLIQLSLLLFFVVLGMFAAPSRVHAQGASAFPLYYESEDTAGEKKDKGALWPFMRDDRTTQTLVLGLHPIASYYYDRTKHTWGYDVLWPFFRHRYRPQTPDFDNWETDWFFPLFFSGYGDKREGGHRAGTTIILPLVYTGSDGPKKNYFVFLPIFFYGHDAHLRFFPRSTNQNFFAIFPLYGDFKNAKNRLRFALWPLFVQSTKYRTDGKVTKLTSFPWPFLAVHSGEDLWGFRLWPLFAYANEKDQFSRAYFLWPLGQWKDGRVSQKDPSQQRVRMLFPFFVDFKREKFHFFSLFPAYASVKQKGRYTRGFLLAIFNIDENYRIGIRDYRFLWFLVRIRERIPATAALPGSTEPERRGSTGSGFFPLYWAFHSQEKGTRIILWPIWTERRYKYRKYDFYRTQIPFLYSKRNRHYPDGKRMGTEFFFPFFQRTWKEDGKQRIKSFHFWVLKDIDALDRNWSPLWTFWEKFSDIEKGTSRVRVMRGLYDTESSREGVNRWRFNLGFVDVGARSGDEKAGGHFDLFWGLYGRKKIGDERRTRLFWIKL